MKLSKPMKKLLHLICTELEWEATRVIELTPEDRLSTIRALVSRGYLLPESEVTNQYGLFELTQSGVDVARQFSLDDLDLTSFILITT